MTRDNSIWYAAMHEAGHSHEVCVSEERGLDVADELADITTAELFAELIIRIECTNGLDFISHENVKGLVSRLVDHLDETEGK